VAEKERVIDSRIRDSLQALACYPQVGKIGPPVAVPFGIRKRASESEDKERVSYVLS
jgi:hypothetical protein